METVLVVRQRRKSFDIIAQTYAWTWQSPVELFPKGPFHNVQTDMKLKFENLRN